MAKRKSSPHVPEQYRGFSLQATRMAHLLVGSPPGTSVSLELLDDVAAHFATGEDQVVQTKDPAATNPVQDRSVQLWKTFANWTRDAREGRLDPSRTSFELYVSKKVRGKLVALLHEADSQAKANLAFDHVRKALWGNSPKFEKRSAVAATLKAHLDEVFETGPSHFRKIIERFKLTCAIRSPERDLHQSLHFPAHSDQVTVDLVVFVHGWVKTQIDAQLRERRAPVVSRDEFHRQLQGFFNRLVPNGALPDVADSPKPHELSKLMKQTFVRQMEIIGCDERAKLRSMTCFFKACEARTKWAVAGTALSTDESLEEYQDALRQVWNSHQIEIYSDPHRTDEVIQGKRLLAACELENRPVEGKIAPNYFTPGCFHDLADSLSIGWHPQWATLVSPDNA